jgi:hypothetical protein
MTFLQCLTQTVDGVGQVVCSGQLGEIASEVNRHVGWESEIMRDERVLGLVTLLLAHISQAGEGAVMRCFPFV